MLAAPVRRGRRCAAAHRDPPAHWQPGSGYTCASRRWWAVTVTVTVTGPRPLAAGHHTTGTRLATVTICPGPSRHPSGGGAAAGPVRPGGL
jgi:hypothetical protein